MTVTVIAEAGVNHDGDLNKALALVDAAAAAGAHVVKFQTFRASALVTAAAPKADYQKVTTGSDDGQYAMLARLELDEAAHRTLMARCAERGITFLSTPFDPGSLAFLVEELGLSTLKFSSGDLTNGPLLLDAARRGVAVILSTGMSTLADVREALGVLAYGYLGGHEPPGRAAFAAALEQPEAQALLREKVTLLHCTTDYPAPVAEVNLRAMQTLRDVFGLPVGYSDHTQGIAVTIAAAALGAQVVEKHFTLDRNAPGPDHRASLEPGELAALVEGVAVAELALGSPEKGPTPSEARNMAAARKSLVAASPIRAGEAFTAANLAVMRPGTGASPMAYWDHLGRSAMRDYAAGEVIAP